MKNTITDPQYLAMKAFSNANEHTSDGAFFGMAQELGWDVDDWAWYADLQKLDPEFK